MHVTWVLTVLYLDVAYWLWQWGEGRWWLFLFGVVGWTFAEYWFHRYLHWTEGHGILDIDNHKHHHDAPEDDGEIHYTFVESGAMTGLLVIVAWLLGGLYEWVSGFLVTYVIYEWFHLAAHRNVVGLSDTRMIKYHQEHHKLENGTRFGFLTDIWDKVFGTYKN